MSIGLGDRLGRLTQVVKVAQLVRYSGQGAGNRFANRLLSVGDNGRDGYRESIANLADQSGDVLDGGGQETPGQQHLTTQTVAEHPENFMADMGLQAID